MATRTAVIPPIPSWVIWDDLTLSEQETLSRMWNQWLDNWLDYSIGLLDSELPVRGVAVSWEGRQALIDNTQLALLKQNPAGEERREHLFRMLRQRPDYLSE